MKFLYTLLFILLFCHAALSQEKKIIVQENIKSQVIWLTYTRFFKEVKYKSQELRFDRRGNPTEEIRFNKSGDITYHKALEYDKELITREINLDKKGRIVSRTDYRYIGNLLVEKWTYDGDGNKIKTEQLIYEKQD
jgi:hypothetical protein